MRFSVEQGMSAFPWGARAELPGVSECLVFPYNLTLHFWEATLYGQRITRLCPWARMLSETPPTRIPCSWRPFSISLSPMGL